MSAGAFLAACAAGVHGHNKLQPFPFLGIKQFDGSQITAALRFQRLAREAKQTKHKRHDNNL